MGTYALRRLGQLIPLLVGLTMFSFVLGQLAPGDPARTLLRLRLGVPPTERQVQAFRATHGYDDPLAVQYGRWLTHAVAGDLGVSVTTGQPVARSLRRALPVTFWLALLAFLLAVLAAVPLGVAAAVAPGRVLDHVSRLLALAGASLPTYIASYLLVLLLAVRLEVVPPFWDGSIRSYVMPVIALALYGASVMLRLTRASVLEVLNENFVSAARGRGLPERRVVLVHVLPVALIPVLTYAGLVLGGLLAGSVIVDHVFGIPGLGAVAVEAIGDRDVPTVQGFVLLLGSVVLLVNLAVDLLSAALDPRVRLAR